MELEKRKKAKKRVSTVAEVEIDLGEEGNELKKLKNGEEAAAGGSGAGDHAAVPTEEEVDEFFAILRRMKVAVDYFDHKGKGGKEWREVLEQVDFTVDDDDDGGEGDRRDPDGDAVKKKASGEAAVNEGFDLNAVAPEAADA